MNKQCDGWRTNSESIVYDNAWISVSHREVTAPTGKDGVYGVVQFKNRAMAILPIDNEGNIWLVGQHRYPLNQYSWEVPEGGAPVGESVLGAAQRELREETGIVARLWTSLLHSHLSNSVSDEYAIAYIARQLSFNTIEPDDTELIDVRKIPLDDAINLVMDGSITDALSMLCLMKLKLLLDSKQLVL
ncbi:MAG: NUDIX domain-containing protein [Granulosicoccus sp.]